MIQFVIKIFEIGLSIYIYIVFVSYTIIYLNDEFVKCVKQKCSYTYILLNVVKLFKKVKMNKS